MSDILSRIKKVLNEQESEIIKKKADRLNLKQSGWGHYTNFEGESFSFDKNKKTFVPGVTDILADDMDKVHNHFIKKYKMKRVDENTLSDEAGSHWSIDVGNRKLVKIKDGSKDLKAKPKKNNK